MPRTTTTTANTATAATYASISGLNQSHTTTYYNNNPFVATASVSTFAATGMNVITTNHGTMTTDNNGTCPFQQQQQQPKRQEQQPQPQQLDLDGNNNNNNGDLCSQIPDLVRCHVHDVIQYSLPYEQTRAYLQAMKQDSEMVHIETDPIQYVRYCNYDLWAGAQRLCLYWTIRVELFGIQRAFLPLTITGTGALTSEDVITVHCAAICLLPKTRIGQSCILVDRRKLLPNLTAESRLRAIFYILSMMVQEQQQHERQRQQQDDKNNSNMSSNNNNNKSDSDRDCMDQKNQAQIQNPYDDANEQQQQQQVQQQVQQQQQRDVALFLMVMVTPRNHAIDWNFMHRASSITKSIFPIRLQFHLLGIPHKNKIPTAIYLLNKTLWWLERFFGKSWGQEGDDGSGSGSSSIDNAVCDQQEEEQEGQRMQQKQTTTTMQSTKGGFTKNNNNNNNIQVHIQTEPDRILKDLISLGMRKKGIPLFLGGEWEYNDFYQWCQYRKVVEEKQYKDRLLKDPPTTQQEQQQQQEDSDGTVQGQGVYSKMSTTTTTTNRKRGRRQGQQGQEQVVDVDAISAAIRSSFCEDDRLAKRRNADLFHSRRKRERKRNEIRNLKEECSTLMQERDKLHLEYNRLQRLMKQVQEEIGLLFEREKKMG